jgi:hypothetical protein
LQVAKNAGGSRNEKNANALPLVGEEQITQPNGKLRAKMRARYW